MDRFELQQKLREIFESICAVSRQIDVARQEVEFRAKEMTELEPALDELRQKFDAIRLNSVVSMEEYVEAKNQLERAKIFVDNKKQALEQSKTIQKTNENQLRELQDQYDATTQKSKAQDAAKVYAFKKHQK